MTATSPPFIAVCKRLRAPGKSIFTTFESLALKRLRIDALKDRFQLFESFVLTQEG
jgi:hypothetical protein